MKRAERSDDGSEMVFHFGRGQKTTTELKNFMTYSSFKKELLPFLFNEYKCKQRLRSKVWWVGMDKDVEKVCKSCESCQLVSSYDLPVPIVTTEMPTSPWKFCSIDLLGPLPDGRSVIAVVEYFSRYFEAALTKSTKTGAMIEFLDSIFVRFGYPEVLRTDNGPQFVSNEFQAFLHSNGIRWLSTVPL